jgi:hypothetical protein
MKKLIVIVAALLATLLIAGCATPGPSASEMMASAKGNAPDGSLVGQGTGTAGKDKDAAMKKAEQNARFQLVRGLTFVIKDLVDEAVAQGRLTSSTGEEFRQGVNTALSRSTLPGATKVDSGFGSGDVAWCIFYLEKGDALKIATSAVNAAKEVVSAGPFNLNNFDAKFAAAAGREWK